MTAARLARCTLLAVAVAACSGTSGKPSGAVCGRGCLVDGRCVAEGDACDDGLFCTVADRCVAGRCTGVARDCDDRIGCNGAETCDEAAKACRAGTPTCVAGEVCDATQDRCVRPCLGCVVDGVCWRDGQVNPDAPCLGCDTRRAQFAWSPRDGLPCDDGRFCTVNDTCSGGTCAGVARSCSDGLACDGVETCDEAAGACRPGTSPCAAGEVCDAVADACTRLVCTAGCLVANVCWGPGQVNPATPCLVCDPARSAVAWSPRDGAACDDGRWCTVNDTCSGGACAGVPRSCSDGRVCNGVETCDEAADACAPHPVAGCESSAACADACTQLGQLLPYFVATVQGPAAPTAGGSLVTLVGSFPDLAGATLVDRASGTSLAAGVTSWAPDRIQLRVPAGARDREITFTAGDGTPVPFTAEVVRGWQRAFVQRATFPIRYAPPVVAQVSGCVEDTGTVARACNVGGQVITVRGTDLGDDASAIEVDVDGRPCGSVALVTPHGALTCLLGAAPADGFDLPVTVTVGGRSGTLAGAVSYHGPEISSVSPTMVSSTALDPRGGDTVVVGGRFFGTSAPEVAVQLGDDPNLVVSVTTVMQDAAMVSTLVFHAPPGIGVGYPVTVKVGEARTRRSVQTLGYRVPAPVDGTTRGAPGAPGQSSYATLRLPASIFLDVVDAGPRASDLDVRLVDGDGEAVPCVDPALAPSTGTRATLSCTLFTNLSSRDVPLGAASVRIAVHGAVAAATDEVFPPQAPVLSAVSGCVDVGPATRDCPTRGGVVMTVTGQYLGAPELVFVGDVLVDPDLAPTSARFVLPPGVGSARVFVRDGALCSAPGTIDYAAPTVATVSGCVDWQATTGDCPIAGGIPLTITGSNLGASGAVVFVGAAACASVVHDPAAPHERLTCILPAGAGTDLPVLVVNGKLSTNAGSLSYRLP